jgi:hypothetical protein
MVEEEAKALHTCCEFGQPYGRRAGGVEHVPKK